MINFRLGAFLDGLNYLKHELANAQAGPPDTLVSEDHHSRVKGAIEIVIRVCAGDLRIEEARHTWAILEELFNIYGKQKYTYRTLADLLQRLYADIERGASQQYFFHYPTNLAPLAMPTFEGGDVRPEWTSIASAFTASKREIEAGIDCFALTDYPGCIFHMIRIAEMGLRAMARECGKLTVRSKKPIEYAMWGEVIRAIDDAIKDIENSKGRKKPMSPKQRQNREEALLFYKTILSDMRVLNELRDRTVHLRDNYDEGQALTAISRTNEMMSLVATKLNENSAHKIKWNL